MQKLKDWFRKDSIGVWMLIIAIMIPALAIDSSQSQLPRLFRFTAVAVIVAGISKWWKRLLTYIMIVILSGFAMVHYSGPDRLMSEVSLIPPPNGPEVVEPVILGGDAIWYSEFNGQTTRQYKATICFYTEDGWGAAVAHPSNIPTDASVMVSGGRDAHLTEGRVVNSSSFGLVLAEMRSPGGRVRWDIAQPNEISVGADAVVHTLDEDITLAVVGFMDRSGRTELVLRSPIREHPILPGMSGSPIAQNGKIIAFLAATANYKDQFVYAPLATDVYWAMHEVRKDR